MTIETGYVDLCAAIILRAREDYKSAVNALATTTMPTKEEFEAVKLLPLPKRKSVKKDLNKRKSDYLDADVTRYDCEMFFKSDWFKNISLGLMDGGEEMSSIRDKAQCNVKAGKTGRAGTRKDPRKFAAK